MYTKKDLRIVYMGTPDFAVAGLQALVEGGYNVVGVITMPDKPAGRGHKLQASAVKNYATAQGLPTLQPEKLKDETFLEALREWNADLQIVVAFRMLPEVVWNMPPLGTFNLHGSLLPQYRGAAPINWAVINGETETGVTTFFLTHEIDTGNIILQEKIPILPDENVGTIHDRLMHIGAGLVTKTVDRIIAGDIEAQAQSTFFTDESALKAAPKIFKETCRIQWDQPAAQVHNLIRGMSPYPAAWSEMTDGEQSGTIKIYASQVIDKAHQLTPGTIVCDNKSTLDVATSDGFIRILSLQIAGKKRMDTASLLNGYKLNEHHRFA